MPVIDKGVEHYNLNEHYGRLSLVASGRAGKPSTCRRKTKDSRLLWTKYFWSKLSLARRLVEAGPASSRSFGRRWPIRTTTRGRSQGFAQANERPIGTHARCRLSGLVADLDQRGLLEETMVVCVRRIRTQSAEGREHFREREQCRWSGSLALLLYRRYGRSGYQAGLRARRVGQDRLP